TIAGGILMMIVIVTVHELGHLLVARACGVGVESFSIGFGWWSFKMFTIKGIPFYFRPILLGGFVKIKSRELKNAVSDGKYLEEALWWQKILFFAAGVGFNLITAVVLRTLIFWFAPADTQVHILQLKFAFLQVPDWYMAPFYAIKITCLSFIDFFFKTVEGIRFICWKTVAGLIASLWTFLAGSSIPGAVPFTPIPNAGMAGQVGLGANAHLGFWSFVGLVYLVSIMIAALNILPLRPFDGGHIVITLLERIFGDNRITRFITAVTTYAGLFIVIVILFNMLMSDGTDLYRFIKK
ncbi:MAG: site-2 protease family protein, partial [Patescibacteria group bacterium]